MSDMGIAAMIALALLLAAETGASPYTLDMRYDVPALLISGGLASIALVKLPPPACLPSCDPAGIGAFDRGVIGNYSERIHTVADFVVLGTVLLPPLVSLLEHGLSEDLFIFGEALLVAQGLAQLSKAAVRRNAPLVYDPNVPLEVKMESADAVRSFYSGHTTTAFTAATTFATTYWLRNPESRLRFLIVALGAIVATSVGFLKMEAGYHYPTDIIAGAATGIGVGLLIPFLHLRDEAE